MRILGRLRLSRYRDSSTSIERQREIIEAYAKAHDHEVVAWAEDVDVSRTVHPLKAPALAPWLTDPEKIVQYDGIAAWRLDRLGAGSVNISWLLQWCQEHGKTLISVTENLDFSTWVGRLVGGVIAGVAEGEVEGDRERVISSREKLRRLGRWPGGLPPYGYRVEKRGDGHYLVIDPAEGAIVREIFDRVANRESLTSVTQDLNDRGIPARLGGRWTVTSLRRMIHGRWVLGQSVHRGRVVLDDNGEPLQFSEPIVTEDKWWSAREILSDRSRPRIRKTRRGFLLHILHCYRCGRRMHSRTHVNRGKAYRYWMCYGRVQGLCDAPSIRAEAIEGAVTDWVYEEIGRFEVTEKVFVPASDNSAELERVTRAIEGIRRERDLGLYDGEDEAYYTRLKSLVDRKRSLEEDPGEPAHWVHRGTGKTYGELWPTLSDEERRELLADAGVRVEAQVDPWTVRIHVDMDALGGLIPEYEAPAGGEGGLPADVGSPAQRDSD